METLFANLVLDLVISLLNIRQLVSGKIFWSRINFLVY